MRPRVELQGETYTQPMPYKIGLQMPTSGLPQSLRVDLPTKGARRARQLAQPQGQQPAPLSVQRTAKTWQGLELHSLRRSRKSRSPAQGTAMSSRLPQVVSSRLQVKTLGKCAPAKLLSQHPFPIPLRMRGTFQQQWTPAAVMATAVWRAQAPAAEGAMRARSVQRALAPVLLEGGAEARRAAPAAQSDPAAAAGPAGANPSAPAAGAAASARRGPAGAAWNAPATRAALVAREELAGTVCCAQTAGAAWVLQRPARPAWNAPPAKTAPMGQRAAGVACPPWAQVERPRCRARIHPLLCLWRPSLQGTSRQRGCSEQLRGASAVTSALLLLPMRTTSRTWMQRRRTKTLKMSLWEPPSKQC
mmetsp:Transcript_139892/g.389900  ORF Transcript_139892/g.389900 Transcript_139892/m.389900 type:complete len:361 (+) Transcript_139892:851-1933(+)